MKHLTAILVFCLILPGLSNTPENHNAAETAQKEAQSFIDSYTDQFIGLYLASGEAEWKSNTYIVAGDEKTQAATEAANQALATFTGSKSNIEGARKHLAEKDMLTSLQVKQLEAILYAAANNPQTVPDLVRQRIKAEAEQNSRLFGFEFMLNGEPVSKNDLNTLLRSSEDPEERLKAWEASKAVGAPLKSGLENLRNLRNQTVGALGYSDYFAYQVSEYGMTTDEMVSMNQRLIEEIRPLYRQLHTYARYELAKKYGVSEVPDMIPAHWLPNQWGQDWNAMVEVQGFDLDGALQEKSAEWLIEQGERFYQSMGFEPLPKSFWDKSSLYPLPADAKYKKNNHASAWHMDLQDDVRCLMSVIPNADWYETVHHELGHIYYYIAYTNPNVPVLLRSGANRATHEAVGSLLGLAAMQKPFLQHLNLLPEDAESDEMQVLLKEALNYIIFIPWSAGVMTGFEHELYARNLPIEQFNQKWWELKRKYQGIEAPSIRGEEYCDAASKTHISNDAAQYYDYALSYIQLFQIHDYIARNILKQDPRATNYYGSEAVGAFLNSILEKGASEDWRELMREKLGEDLTARPMLNYFQPLMVYLEKVNKGRKHTL